MMRPGSAQKRSQIDAPRPSIVLAPSICAALVAAPQVKSGANMPGASAWLMDGGVGLERMVWT